MIEHIIDVEEKKAFTQLYQKRRWDIHCNTTGFYPDYQIEDGHVVTLQFNLKIKRVRKIIEDFPFLNTLIIYGNSTKKIEVFDNLPKLKKLMFKACDIKKIANLEYYDFLEKLSIESCKISTIEGLERLTELKTLCLNRNSIKKIQNLDTLSSLDYLDLSSNNIKKIEGLDNLSTLKYLNLEKNQIKTIEGLDNLTSLTTLVLSDNKIAELQNMENLNNLKTLWIEFKTKRILNLEILSNFKHLKDVYLSDTQLSVNINDIRKIEEQNPDIKFNGLQKDELPPPAFYKKLKIREPKYRPWRHD